MHYHLEIVMPQVDDVEAAVATVMKPFDENTEHKDRTGAEFWDWYVVGGRWAGDKLKAGLDEDKVQEFYDALTEKKITVSGLTCGKESLAPPEQIPMVDKLWAEYFPQYEGRACPLFNHANDAYHNQCLYGDVMPFSDVPPALTCARVIFAAPDREGEVIRAEGMFSDSIWNGVNFEDTAWDGTMASAITLFDKRIATYRKEYRAKVRPGRDWLVVTVDYHN